MWFFMFKLLQNSDHPMSKQNTLLINHTWLKQSFREKSVILILPALIKREK
jgi:putative AlgH/UPF0301 family transcriptional regulator